MHEPAASETGWAEDESGDGSAAQGRMSRLQVRHLGRIEYGRALALQETLLAAKIAGDTTDYLLLLEHEAVYTLGRGADEADLSGAPARTGVPVFRVGRGGGATFHGPGQLVGYPIVRLWKNGRDVHRYVRGLEATLIDTCRGLGVVATAPPGLTGVWVGDEKLASIGVGVRRGITWHGVALNVSTDVSYFELITACRLPQLRVTTLERLLGEAPSMDRVADAFTRGFAKVFGYPGGSVEIVP